MLQTKTPVALYHRSKVAKLMTLILAHRSPGGIVFASDRRVTLRHPNRPDSVYSEVENKTIIFHMDDAVGVIGYTGPAYIGTQPTDVWLASLVANQNLTNVGMARMGRRKVGRLNPMTWRIKTAIEGLMLHRDLELTILLNGWRWRRRYMVPFTQFISNQLEHVAGLMRPPQSPTHRVYTCQIGDRMLPADIDAQIHEALQDEGSFSLEAVRRGLIGAIRHRAIESSTVGTDLMTVWIPPIGNKRVLWRFEPSSPRLAAIDVRFPQQQIAVAFSPWIISPIGIYAPAIGNLHFQPQGGGWTYLCMNDPAPMPLPYYGVRRQNRRGRP